MAYSPKDEISLGDVLSLLRRHRLMLAVGVLIGAGLAIAYTMLTTPVYEATTTVRIQSRQANLPEVFSAAELRDEVITEMEELESRTLAEHVAVALGLQLQLAPPAASERTQLIEDVEVEPDVADAEYRFRRQSDGRFAVTSQEGPALGPFATGSRIELPGASFVLTAAAASHEELELIVAPLDVVVEGLREQVRVTRSNDEANIIALRYQNVDRRLARAVLGAWTERYVETGRDVQQAETRSLVAFLRTQLDTLLTELSSAQEALRDFRERENVLNPEVETESAVERHAELRAERAQIEAERQALSQLVEEVRSAGSTGADTSAAAYRRLIAFPPLLRTQAASQILNSLADIEREQTMLSQRRSLEDPDIQVLLERRRQLEGQLRGIAQTYLSGLEAQVTALDREIAASSALAGRIPERDVEYARLHRAPEVLTEMATLMQTRLKEAEIAQAAHQPIMRVVDAAHTGSRPVSPRPTLNLAFGLFFGMILGVFGAFAREYLDRSIHTRQHVEAVTGAPVLGLIPRLSRSAARLPKKAGALPGGKSGRLTRRTRAPDPAAYFTMAVESYARLHLNVSAVLNGNGGRTLLLTSPLSGDGKTTTAKNLAVSLSQRGFRALLVDADLRRGQIHRLLGSQRAPGLTDILEGRASYADAVRRVEIDGKELDYLPCGARSEQIAALLRSDRLSELVRRASADYEAVIIDSPPLNLVSDAAVLSDLVDGVLVVVRAGTTAMDALDFTMRQLRLVDAPVLGTVLNDIDPDRESTYDGSYKYLGFKDYTYFGDGT